MVEAKSTLRKVMFCSCRLWFDDSNGLQFEDQAVFGWIADWEQD
jgi:hypothetical protein